MKDLVMLYILEVYDDMLSKNIKNYILGILGKDLHNWNKATFVIFLLISIVITGLHCSNNEAVRGITTKQGLYSDSNWIGDDIFVITAIGAPKRNLVGIEKRKKSAFHAAVLNAQYQTLTKFMNSRSEDTTSEVSEEILTESRENRKTLKGVIKNGIVKNIRYDKDQFCEIDFQVHYKGLKNFVKSASLK